MVGRKTMENNNATQLHFVKLVPLLLEKKPCLFFFLLWNFLHYRHWWTWDSSKHDWWVFVFIRPWEILLCSTDVASHNTFLHGRFLRSRLMKKFLVCNRSTKMEVTQSEFNPAYMGTFSNGVNFWHWTNQKYFYCCWCYICIIIVVFFLPARESTLAAASVLLMSYWSIADFCGQHHPLRGHLVHRGLVYTDTTGHRSRSNQEWAKGYRPQAKTEDSMSIKTHESSQK